MNLIYYRINVTIKFLFFLLLLHLITWKFQTSIVEALCGKYK